MRSLRGNKTPVKVVPGLREIKIPKDVQAEILPIQFLVLLFKKKIPISSYLDQSKDQLDRIRVVVIREIIAAPDKAEGTKETVDQVRVVIKAIADRDKAAVIKAIADQANKLDLEIVLAEADLEIVPVARADVRCRLLLRK